MQKNIREMLIADLQQKEQSEHYLSNLEGLKRAGSVEENLYNALKKEYVSIREEALQSIKALKTELQEELAGKKTDLAVYKEELYNLETRFKVGQLTGEAFEKRKKVPSKKAAELEQQIAELQLMVDANTAHSLHIEPQPQKSKWPLLFKRKKQERVPVPALVKTEIVQLPRDVPPDEIIEEAIVLPSTDTIQTDDIELSPAPPPPTILITDLTVMPDRVVREGTLGIMANAHNRTPEELTDIVELNIDGKLEQAMTVTLQPGEVRDITFIITAREEGNHTVTLGSITGTFMVYPPG